MNNFFRALNVFIHLNIEFCSHIRAGDIIWAINVMNGIQDNFFIPSFYLKLDSQKVKQKFKQK
jgi:hypothetical protein